MDMSPEQVQEVLTVLSGILHLGNISFVAATGAQIADKAVLATTAGLFSLDVDRLGDALTQKFMVLRGEEIKTPLTKEQVQCMSVCSELCTHSPDNYGRQSCIHLASPL